MHTLGVQRASQRLRVLIALAVTLVLIHVIPDNRLVIAPLVLCWTVFLWPINRSDLAVFVFAGGFFLIQNYLALLDGIFEFRDKDILLMPYFEPLLWGFYFTALRRFIADSAAPGVRIGWKNFAAVAMTSAMFSLFSFDSHALFAATACSTAVLFAMFHEKEDWQYAGAALALGVIIELFGVWTGLWWYPSPDFLGVPLWFSTMWLSVGVLGRRFAIPAAEWLASRGEDQGAYRPGARIS